MHTHSLFTLLGEKLMLNTNTVTVTTYNALYEVTNAFPTNVLVSMCRACDGCLPSPPDPDRASVHTGSSQTSS